jgi:hypothetical protein
VYLDVTNMPHKTTVNVQSFTDVCPKMAGILRKPEEVPNIYKPTWVARLGTSLPAGMKNTTVGVFFINIPFAMFMSDSKGKKNVLYLI